VVTAFSVSLLKGDFVTLEPLSLQHLVDLEQEFDPSLFDYYPKPYATAREFVEENLQMQLRGDYFPFVILNNSNGEAIGCTEFSNVDMKNRRLEIGGSWLKPRYHGSVANTEAKFLLLRHCFEVLTCVRVQFTAHSLNVRSRAGIEGIGGRFEGIIRNAMILPDGTLRDDACYSIVAGEWLGVRARIAARMALKTRI
jgi:N-acetyltransferase